MGDISSVAEAVASSQSIMTADAVSISVMKQQFAIEQQLAEMIASTAQAAVLPAGQGMQIDHSI
jgi:hypothetical protein